MKNILDYSTRESRPQPDTFHEHTGHYLDPEKSKVHDMINQIEDYAKENKIKLNYKKTKLIVFNPGLKRDFFPRFSFNESELQVVDESKLLGVIIRNDLSWSSHTSDIIKRGNKKLWCLKRLKKFGASTQELLDVYNKQVGSLLEFAAPVWHPSLTGGDKRRIERVQKSAFSIILGRNFKSYRRALSSLKMDSLFVRREKLCKKFALKSLKHPKFKNWFKLNSKPLSTREEISKFCEIR